MTAAATPFARALALRDAGRFAQAEAELGAATEDLEALALLVQLQLNQGREAAAQVTVQRLEALEPEAAPTLRARSRLLLRRGQAEAAVAAAQAAVAAQPGRAENSLVLAAALLATGGESQARTLADAVISDDPRVAEAYILRAQIAARQNRHHDAAEACEAALRLKPTLPLWTLLASMRQAAGEAVAAAEAYRQALARDPDDLAALLALAEMERRAGRTETADALYRQASDRAPGRADVWSAYGLFLQQQGRAADAAAAYERGLSIDPAQVAVLLNLATVQAEQGFNDRAEATCRRAVALRPTSAGAYFGLAHALQSQHRLEEGLAAARQALSLDPQLVPARLALAEMLRAQGDLPAAQAEFDKVLSQQPGFANALNARLSLPVVPASDAEILAAREAYRAAIAQCREAPGELRAADPPAAVSWFQLAYHGLDNRPIMEALDRLFDLKAPTLAACSPHVARWRAPLRGERRIKVGFVSQFFGRHTIGRLYQGLIAGLDRSRFEVVLAHLPRAKRDEMRDELDGSVDASLDLPARLDQQHARLTAEAFDVLFFADIGMVSSSYWLARARMAPVQAVGWGHPDTTGLATLDYYLSFDRAEPEGAEACYTERLVRLPRLACHYARPIQPRDAGRGELGLPDAGRLYGCLQSLFKLHPDFDAVLADIATRDPTGWIVLAEGSSPAWEHSLRRRWAERAPAVNDRALFLPRRPMAEYFSLVAALDVHLDTPHFGSGATFYDAMAVGAPVVTWPAAFARGRVVAGLYGQMGVGADLIVDRLEDYAARAVALARDGYDRAALRAAADAELFEDDRAVAGFAAFLEAAVEAAGRGERLPARWAPR